MIQDIIDTINQALSGIFPAQKCYSLAQSVLRNQGSEVEVLPGEVNKDGEIVYVGLDDVYSLITYHKLSSIATTQLPNGRGDNPGDLQNNYQLSLVAYWDRKKLNAMPDEMLLLLQSRWPRILVGADIKTGTANFGATITNSLQIFNTEYQGTKFRLPANHSLMQINYTLSITFNPLCIPKCL